MWLATAIGCLTVAGCNKSKRTLPSDDVLAQAKTLDLSSLGLKTMPFAMRGNPNLRELNLSGNQLSSVPDWLWQLPQLKFISLNNNRLDSINVPVSAVVSEFSAHNNKLIIAKINGAYLEHLDLGYNIIRKITLDSTCRRLNYIQLSKNKLESIDVPKSTKALLVDSNELRSISAQAGSQIELLSANSNQLSRIGIPIANARYIYLENNKLRSWRTGDYPNLKVLKLRGNQLQFFGKLEAKSLELLDLGGNEITNFAVSSINAPLLRNLFLNDGRLREVNGNLAGLPELRTLDLGSNQLTTIILTKSGPHLARIDLSENKLKIVPDFLKSTLRLRYLRIENNRLTALPAWLQTLPHLERIWAQNNYINEFPRLLIGHAPIQLANLSNNPFKFIPDTMSVGGQLSILYLHRVGMKTVPKWVFDCVGVDILGLAENPIEVWPAELSKLTRLRMLHWQKSGLMTLPASLPKYARLEKIDMRKTKLSAEAKQKLRRAYGDKVKF